MPVPKRKTSKSRRDMRSACKFLRPQAFGACSYCGAPIIPHVVCLTCGYYKGKKILATKLDRALKRGELRSKAAETQQALSTQESSSKASGE
jgi:large subunit ribosomal protein L32